MYKTCLTAPRVSDLDMLTSVLKKDILVVRQVSSDIALHLTIILLRQLASRGMALRVIGIDDGSKEQFVRDCGAEHFIDITKHDDKSIAEEVIQVAGGLGASAVIVCTGVNKAYAQALDFLRFGGTVVCVGVPEGEPQPIAKSDPPGIIFKQATITGVAVGNRRDAIECLDFAARGIIKTHIRVEKMENLTDVSILCL